MPYEKPFALIGIGIPGSGKTTTLRPYAETLEAEYLSADDERRRLGNESDQSLTPKAWSAVHDKAAFAIEQGRSIVIDGTFSKEADRRREIIGLRDMGAKAIIGVYFPVDLTVALARIEQRIAAGGRSVPRYAIERMHTQLEQAPPSHHEGFDDIVIIKS